MTSFSKGFSYEFYGLDSDWADSNSISECFELDQILFPNPWTMGSWENCLKQPQNYCLIIMKDIEGKTLGLSLFQMIHAEGLAHLLKILILPEHRGFGLGRELLDKSMKHLRNIGAERFFLEVEQSNKEAIGLYQRLGFMQVANLKNFYGSERHGNSMILIDSEHKS